MKLLTTYNLRLTTKRKAFTLMEVLIAASIFAIVMVIATGILGQSSSFRSKIKAQRDASGDAKKIADMITRDVKEAGYPAKIYTHGFKTGISLISKGSGDYEQVNNVLSASGYPYIVGTTGMGAVLILADKDNYKIYRYDNVSKNIYYKTIPRLSGSNLYEIVIPDSPSGDFAINSTYTKLNSDNTEIIFAADGFAPEDDDTALATAGATPAKQQPYIRFSITAQTKGYDGLSPNSRATMEIRSAVTARSFAN